MELKPFSQKQLAALCWWAPDSPWETRDAVICDGAVRSGKTLCLGLGFVSWGMASFANRSFGLCGKTIRSLRRNLVTTLIPALTDAGFACKSTQDNCLTVSLGNHTNRFFLFGGRDAGSPALIQGITLAGVLFDEVTLMPREFVEQALARCSVEGSKFWFNCNPESPRHWFYQNWIQRQAEKNALYLHYTMEDNPALSPKMRRRYQALYDGVFYQRYVQGQWVAAEGLVYPFMTGDMLYAPPSDCTLYRVSCDYGTVNPCSFGLWGLSGEAWYRVDECYFDSRKEGSQRTDEEHYQALEALCAGKNVDLVAVDPSAASFLEVIRRHGKFRAVPAENQVADGIRQTAAALKQGSIRICRCCADTIREFGMYRWDTRRGQDAPMKENDHAMDDIRYFVSTLMRRPDPFFVSAQLRWGTARQFGASGH